jgi:hypothetical protein
VLAVAFPALLRYRPPADPAEGENR